MHLTFDYDYLRSETDFTEMEGLEEVEGMEEMEERKEWLRTGSVPSPLRDAMMSSSAKNHTSYLSREPRVYPCKFFLAGVNFYRYNAKNWKFIV